MIPDGSNGGKVKKPRARKGSEPERGRGFVVRGRRPRPEGEAAKPAQPGPRPPEPRPAPRFEQGRPAKPGERRALSNVGGPTQIEGDAQLGALLARALEVPDDPEQARDHVHGFHSYPARLHPDVPAALIRALSPEAGVVLDPFCGSGTVLIEARLLGRRAEGVDANPLAVRLSELKATGRTEAHLEAMGREARKAAEVASERRKKRAGASRRYAEADVAAFAPHVLLELDGIRLGIEQVQDPKVRGDLELVLSSLLTKLSARAGDSAERSVEKRIAAGYPSRLFVAKTDELRARLADYASRLPPAAPLPRVREGDARRLEHLGEASIDLIVTSPPYPGNYDYLHHHAMRLRWLGLATRGLEEREVGARRDLERRSPPEARARWAADLQQMLSEMRRVLRPSGLAVLVLADSVVAGRPYYNDDIVHEAAGRAGLTPRAQASQPREHFHLPSRRAFEQRPRREHAIALAPLPRRR